jgi:NADH:ubiquinone oxidoreductase subunit F (NADH-binding)
MGRSTRSLVLFAIVVGACCTVGTSAIAQIEGGLGSYATGSSAAAFYYISKPGEITMPINLWGYVRNPGRYEVPISTDLVQLVSYAGGPLMDADLGSVRIARVVRREDMVRTVEFTVNLDRLDKLDEKARDLEPGDTVFVERSAISVGTLFNIITAVALVVAAISNAMLAVRAK